MTDDQSRPSQSAPRPGDDVDVRLGEDTMQLLMDGDLAGAKARHDGRRSAAEQPQDDQRTTGELGGAEGEGGAG